MDAGRYAYYWRALNGDFSGWDAEDAPFPGFYRFRPSAHDEFQPVAFWDLSTAPLAIAGQIGQRTGGRGFSKSNIKSAGQRAAIWWGCHRNPITEDQFNHAIAWGEWWDSLRAAGDDAGPGQIVTDINQAAPIGPPSLRRPT